MALVLLAAPLLLAGLASCSREPRVAGETVLLDEPLTLVRGKSIDSVSRELIAPADGLCVAIAEENDVDMVLGLQSIANGSAPAKVEFESGLYGEGVEVGAIPVTHGAKVTVELSSPPDLPVPARSQTRVACYDVNARTPEIQARIVAYRAWSEAALRGASSSAESIQRRRDLYDVAIAKLESDGDDARMAAWAHHIKGVMLHDAMIDLRAAMADSRAAEKAFAALKPAEPRNVARARFHSAAKLTELLNDATWTNPTPEEAKAESWKVFTELATESSPLSALEKARARKFLGVICFQLGDFDCATREYEAAAAAARKVGHRREEISIVHNLGVTAGDLGNFASAVRYYDRVVAIADKTWDPVDYSSFQQNAGVAYASFGDTSRGIEHLLLALEHARQRESALDLGRATSGLGLVYWRRGDVQQAETFYNESLKQRRTVTDGPGLIPSLTMVGRFARYQGRADEALALHREALMRASTPDQKARALYELALDDAAAGQYDRAIALCRDALHDTKTVQPIRRAYIQLALAEFLIIRKPDAAGFAEADQLSLASLAIALAKADLVLEAAARHLRAKLLAARRHYGDARREYEKAIAVILGFRGTTASPELQAATLAYEQDTFREYVDLLMRAAVARGSGHFTAASQDEEDALRVLELARSGNMAAARDLRLDAKTQARVDGLLQQMAAKRVRIAAINATGNPGGQTSEALQLEMSRLRAEVDRLRGSAATEASSGKLPASISRPWPAVAAGVTQLSYALGARNAYLWVRDANGLRVAVLAEPSARLERDLAVFGAINQVRESDQLERSLAALSAKLLPPGALDHASGALEIVAEGSLGTLPFAALQVPGSGKRLVESNAVRMISSMFDMGTAAPAGRRAMTFVGIAGGTGKMRSAGHVFASLGAARAEAHTIANLFASASDAAHVKLLTAADGDAETIRALWAEGVDAVHFATHGLANLRYPSASLLLLPKGSSEQPVYLTAGELQEWRGDTGLVFLAACETAAGPARFAEGMAGLPRSFLGAGARGVVATLWPVEDVYEGEFSVDFYRRFIVGHDAESALAETQRAWLQRRPGESESSRQQRLATAWAHVFHARPKSL